VPARDEIDELIAAGRISEAAAMLERRGQHARAADLYDQLWDHAGVVRAALAAGDLPRALRAALEARDATLQDRLAAAAVELGPAAAASAAAICEERGALERAARLWVAAGDPSRAAAAYERAGFAYEAGCQLEARDPRRAMELFRVHLAALDAHPDGDRGCSSGTNMASDNSGPALDRTEQAGSCEPRTGTDAPRYRLGRLLLRFGRPAEALPLLQRAWRDEGSKAGPAGRACVAALARLGHQHAARHLLALIAEAGAEAPGSVADCCEDPELAAAPEEEGAASGRTLAGRYRLGKLLGSGGMGRVYEATDLLADARVAVKIFTAPGGARGRDAYRRFLREAETTGRLQHPQIVALLDVHEEMGFMVLEHMAGGSLADRLRPRLELPTARAILLQVCAGLAAAHQRGVIHRDLKPTNIFFTAAGAAKLGDFGVAHLQDSGQTQTGAFIGTVAFMAPEQIVGDRVSFATDLYALGVNLHLMLTGALPFAPPDLVSKHLSSPPPRPSVLRPELPPICDEIVLRCMAKRPADRYDSLDALRSDLERIPVDPEPPGLGAAGRVAAPVETPHRRAGDGRFTTESTLLDLPALQALGARDNDLGRAVVLIRIAPTPRRARLLEILAAAAAAGDEHLQRVFSLDRERGQAILEVQLGERGLPALDGDPRDGALEAAVQLGRALAPLHAAGIAHGAVGRRDAVSRCGPHLILSLTAALERGGEEPSPAGDVRAVLELLGLAGPCPAQDGAALAEWALAELERSGDEARTARIGAEVARHLADAPPPLRGGE
jgi:serine/threonine-protein kinase